jgi:hypothetical protein
MIRIGSFFILNIFILYFLILFTLSEVVAQEDAGKTSVSFTIAPPPVGYPEMKAGEQVLKLDGAFLSVNNELMDLKGALPSISTQISPSDVMAINIQAGLGLIKGNKYGLFMMQTPFRLSMQYQMAKTNKLTFFTFGGTGFDLGVSSMNIKQSFGDGSIKTSIVALNFMAPFQGGLQVNYDISGFVLSPYATMNVTMGFVSSTATTTGTVSGFPVSNVSDDTRSIPTFTNIVFGFDALYKPWGVSLSSFIQNSKDNKLLVLTLGKVLSKKMLGDRSKKSGSF